MVWLGGCVLFLHQLRQHEVQWRHQADHVQLHALHLRRGHVLPPEPNTHDTALRRIVWSGAGVTSKKFVLAKMWSAFMLFDDFIKYYATNKILPRRVQKPGRHSLFKLQMKLKITFQHNILCSCKYGKWWLRRARRQIKLNFNHSTMFMLTPSWSIQRASADTGRW